MKTCSHCGDTQDLKCFHVNDYGRPISWCNECMRKKSLENYYRKKGISPNKGLQTESVVLREEKEIKCKSFFFYQHI